MSEPRSPDQGALLKRALVAIDQLQTRLAAEQRARSEPIAVIGIGCRFPGGADDPTSFWRLLEQGFDAVTEVPKERWDVDRYYDPDPDAPGKSYTRWGSFLKDIDQFDTQFFGISPREAVSLDPQQRLLLEVTWQSLENAGIAPSSLQGSQTAVYVGLTTHDYSMRLTASGGTHYADAYTPSGTAHSMAGGRLSYVLGLHGPNVSIDTACSSSLVAVHWAVQSLRNGEANLALAGGVNLTLIPDGSILTSRGRMMSFDGRCKSFDASADGYVRGEGCGMIVFKRLSDAQRDGDTVMAVIRGSALNQDGRSSGLTAPNGPAQEAVIKAALANAGLKPADIGYIEAHGTGTSLGDPIEMKALGGVFGTRAPGAPLMVGSVKTNIGHTEAAAGVVGVIKAVLALQHRAIPPHLHLRQPNPLIAWDRYPIVVPTTLTPWAAPEGGRRRAGVSSFGFSGTNAHVVLEEAPTSATAEPAASDAAGPQLLMVSAETPQALVEMAVRCAAALAEPAAPGVAALARTLAVGRSHFTERLAVVARDNDEAGARLTAFARGDADAPVALGRISGGTVPDVVFMFTGQGAQYAGMGLQLHRSQPVFRAALDECAALLAPHLEHSLLDVIEGQGSAAGLLDDTRYTQPALFAVEYALARLWQSRGIEPTAVLGHSVGEYVAACIAGVFSLEDGLRLIAARGRLMSALPRDGAMAAVFADEASVARAIAPYAQQLAIAAVNGPSNIVISGQATAVDAVIEELGQQGIEAQRLKVSHAFHSPLMDPMLDEFEALAAQVPFSAPRIGLVSNLNGQLVGDEIRSAAYWRRHLRDAVRFADSIRSLHAEGYRVFLEVGPHPTLVGMAERCPGGEQAAWIASLRKGRDDDETMLQNLGALYVRGLMPRVQSLWGEAATRHRAPAPGYAFQRQRFWQDVSVPESAIGLAATRGGHPLLGGVLPSALRIFQSELGVSRQAWLADHRIADFTLFPAAGFLELCGAAAGEAIGRDDWRVSDFRIGEALVLPDDGHVKLQVTLTPGGDASQTVQVFSQSVAAAGDTTDDKWLMHASAHIEPAVQPAPAPIDRSVLALRTPESVDVPAYYELLDAQGAHYGPAFRGIEHAWRGVDEALGQVRLPLAADAQSALMHCHPALLDACFQLVGLVLPNSDGAANTYLPVGVNAYRVHRRAAAQAWCHVRLQASAETADSVHCDLVMFDDAGAAIAEIIGLELRRLNRASLQRAAPKSANAEWAWQVAWQVAADTEPSAAVSGRWLILGDGGGLGAALAARVREQSGTALHLPTLDAGIDAAASHEAALRRLLAQHTKEPFDAIVSLWALDAPPPGDASWAALEAAHRASLASTLGLARALGDATSRLCVVTRGAQAVSDSAVNLAHAPVWGLAGVLASELPALRCVRVDLDPVAPNDEAERLIATLTAEANEDRVALRGGTRWVARLVPGVLEPEGEPPAVQLEIRERGSLSNLALLPLARPAPGPGQVEIRVHATGLNFRDVLNALGMYPGDPGALGNECAGVVSAVGDGVADLQVGDEVISMIDRSFATWVIAPAVLTVRKPAALSFAAAATIPVTFLTAEYALRHLGQMKRGDRVLIHAVTGGVGMAAAQLARRAGAEIFGTAGSPAKRALAASLGVQHVSDSRSLAFATDFMRETDGEGVDIVLNSLAGDFIPTSLQMLRKGRGHFIEIGKTGIWDAERVAAEYPGVAYHALYLGEVAAQRPEFVRQMLLDLLQDFERGVLTPLPQRLYPLSRAEDAFRFMGQGQHVGKIVITQHRAPKPRADASYLVTGGLGGLGLACAEWLAREGARHLLLLGRRAPDDAALACIARLREQGVSVQAARADVSDATQLGAVLQAMRAGMPPLRGILHAAGAIDDAMLAELVLSRFDPVMAPKVRGTWNLHEQTLADPLDFFVMFSSGAGLLGAPGQANYAAANCFMDGFAAWRRAQGRPALSINWGSWSEVGMASGVGESHHRRWAAMGLQMIEPQHGVQMLQDLLYRAEAPQLAALPLVRSRLPAGLGPFLADLRVAAPSTTASTAAASVDMRRVLQATNAPARAAALSAFLADQIVKVLALGAGTRVDLQRSLMEMGLDSLMAMELRNRIQSSVGVRVAVGELLRGPSIAELAGIVLQEMGLDTAAGAPEQIDIEEPAWEEGSL